MVGIAVSEFGKGNRLPLFVPGWTLHKTNNSLVSLLIATWIPRQGKEEQLVQWQWQYEYGVDALRSMLPHIPCSSDQTSSLLFLWTTGALIVYNNQTKYGCYRSRGVDKA